MVDRFVAGNQRHACSDAIERLRLVDLDVREQRYNDVAPHILVLAPRDSGATQLSVDRSPQTGCSRVSAGTREGERDGAQRDWSG